MKLIFWICVLISIFVNISAKEKSDDRLQKILADVTKELRQMFERENQHLRQKDDHLQQQLDELRGQNAKLKEQNDRMHRRNKKLQGDVSKLHGVVKALHQADSSLVASVRQNDESQNGTLNSKTELKKFVDSRIVNYLTNERICVSGSLGVYEIDNTWAKFPISFGYTFPRHPVVSASVGEFWRAGDGELMGAGAQVHSVSNSTAVLLAFRTYPTNLDVAWTACL